MCTDSEPNDHKLSQNRWSYRIVRWELSDRFEFVVESAARGDGRQSTQCPVQNYALPFPVTWPFSVPACVTILAAPEVRPEDDWSPCSGGRRGDGVQQPAIGQWAEHRRRWLTTNQNVSLNWNQDLLKLYSFISLSCTVTENKWLNKGYSKHNLNERNTNTAKRISTGPLLEFNVT